MTELLERAFAAAAKLSPAEQDLLAARLLAELGEETACERAIEQSDDRLTALAAEALAEHHAGLTEELDTSLLPETTLSAESDPVLAALWDNPADAADDRL